MRLSLGNYLKRGVPAPPVTWDYQHRAKKSLAQMYGNDTLGDCVIAGMGHEVGVFTGNGSPNEVILTMEQIIALYSAIGGYVPGDPSTDNGCDEVTALNYWIQKGCPIGANQIDGYIAVNPADPVEYRTALYLFESLFFGLELPDAWVNPFPSQSGFVWDEAGAPDPDNGHCVVGVGYNTQGVIVGTWGMTGLMTDKALQYYLAEAQGGQLFSVLSQESIRKATQKSPVGFDWSQLVADFDSMGGNVKLPPLPAPTT
jgi:hypothetical protein